MEFTTESETVEYHYTTYRGEKIRTDEFLIAVNRVSGAFGEDESDFYMPLESVHEDVLELLEDDGLVEQTGLGWCVVDESRLEDVHDDVSEEWYSWIDE